MNTFLHNAPLVHDFDEEIEPELQLAESIIMGIRLDEGISLSSIRTIFGIDLLKQYSRQVGSLVSSGLLEHVDECIRLTPRGRLLGNEVFWRFLPG